MAAVSAQLQVALDKRQERELRHLEALKRRAAIRGTSATLDANAAAAGKMPPNRTTPPTPKG